MAKLGQKIAKANSAGRKAAITVLSEDEAKLKNGSTTDLIEDLRRVQKEHEGVFISRNFYRKHGKYTESCWSARFGTFEQFRRDSGLDKTRGARLIELHTAKHAAKDIIRGFQEEELNPSIGLYERPLGKPGYKRMMVAADFHGLQTDPFSFGVMIDTIHRIKPDIFVFAGDVYDNYDFSRFDKDPRLSDLKGEFSFVRRGIFEKVREACGKDAQIDMIVGNHDSVSLDTEILTEDGWVYCTSITNDTHVASVNLDDDSITYDKPMAIATSDNRNLLRVIGDGRDELVTDGHNLVINGELVPARNVSGKIKVSDMKWSGIASKRGTGISESMLKVLVWLINDGTYVVSGPNKMRLQWKLSKDRKIERLKSVLEEAGIEYTVRKATMSGCNKIQPYMIRVYGKSARDVISMTGSNKTMPNTIRHANRREIELILDEIKHTDGHYGYTGKCLKWTTTSKLDVDTIQEACITNGIACYYSELSGASGFKRDCKVQYSVSIHIDGMNTSRCESSSVVSGGVGSVVSIQTVNGTLMTRRNGKVHVTGNCHLLRHLAERSPYVRVTMDLMGITLADLFGVTDYEINLVNKADLATHDAKSRHSELRKNYKVYYDMFVVDHFEDRNFGLCGCSGHTHKPFMKTTVDERMGSKFWLGLGCMAKVDAEYVTGLNKYQNGFAIIHLDTEKRSCVGDNIVINDDFAVVGGKVYYRSKK